MEHTSPTRMNFLHNANDCGTSCINSACLLFSAPVADEGGNIEMANKLDMVSNSTSDLFYVRRSNKLYVDVACPFSAHP